MRFRAGRQVPPAYWEAANRARTSSVNGDEVTGTIAAPVQTDTAGQLAHPRFGRRAIEPQGMRQQNRIRASRGAPGPPLPGRETASESRPAPWKLIPPSNAPVIRAVRAARLAPSRTTVSNPWKMCRNPSTAIPSQIGWNGVARKLSTQWVTGVHAGCRSQDRREVPGSAPGPDTADGSRWG